MNLKRFYQKCFEKQRFLSGHVCQTRLEIRTRRNLLKKPFKKRPWERLWLGQMLFLTRLKILHRVIFILSSFRSFATSRGIFNYNLSRFRLKRFEPEPGSFLTGWSCQGSLFLGIIANINCKSLLSCMRFRDWILIM